MSNDIATGASDVGYLQESAVVRMRTPEDLEELSLLKKPQKNTILWCDGLSADGCKHKHGDGEYQAKKSRGMKHDANIQQVQDTVDQLKAKHGSKFT